MSTPKKIYATINLFSESNELFNWICKNLLANRPEDVKREILKMDGSIKELSEHKATISNVLTIITHYELKFELMVVGNEKKYIQGEGTPTVDRILEEQKSDVLTANAGEKNEDFEFPE